jgi:hypothetical protein
VPSGRSGAEGASVARDFSPWRRESISKNVSYNFGYGGGVNYGGTATITRPEL